MYFEAELELLLKTCSNPEIDRFNWFANIFPSRNRNRNGVLKVLDLVLQLGLNSFLKFHVISLISLSSTSYSFIQTCGAKKSSIFHILCLFFDVSLVPSPYMWHISPYICSLSYLYLSWLRLYTFIRIFH